MNQQLKCVQADCNQPRHPGKKYCLDHYKQLDNYAYGLDLEIQKKLDAKLDPAKMAQAQAWIEALTGEHFPSGFAESLKSGIRLCQAINKIKPGSVPNINQLNSPFKHRENIENFLNAEKALGLKEVDLFVTADLYEERNLVAVIDNIFSLGALSMKMPGFRGPYIGVKHADENVRDFAPEVLNAGKALPSRQTVGSYGYQDESKNPVLARQIIKNVSGYEASTVPSKQNMGSYGVAPGRGLSGLDQIIKNPEEVAANRGGGAKPSAAPSRGKYCGGCGAGVNAPSKFCGNCGAAL